MKARILTSVLVAVFAVSTVFAGNPKTNVYKNTEYRDNGYAKEYITVDNEMKPSIKTVYDYTDNDNLLEKSVYKWDSKKGWVSLQKYTYEYDEKGEVINLVYAEYSKNGELLSEQYVDVKNDSQFMAGR